MRISGGKFRGRQIESSPGSHVRPTTDMARVSLFNILSNNYNFEETTILDLFAGTGIIALEFLSRSAKQVTSVEINRSSIFFINNLINQFDLEEKWTVKKMDVMKFIKENELDYDIIFADPPYKWEGYSDLITTLTRKAKKGSQIIVEHDTSTSFNFHTNFIQKRSYGQSAFSFFEIS
jgi:16S rRNA (guanine966-N2)-methyltransferase